MDRKARFPCKWFGLITPLSVLLTTTLDTATLRASPIDDEREPEPTDPSRHYDEPADEAAALNAILTMPEANEDSEPFERFDRIPMPNRRLDENAAQSIMGFLQEETERQQPLQTAQLQ